jgi:hypothetical protein
LENDEEIGNQEELRDDKLFVDLKRQTFWRRKWAKLPKAMPSQIE